MVQWLDGRSMLGAAALVLSFGQAVAANAYQQALAGLEANALDFIQAQGYISVEPQALADDRYYSKEHFPGVREGRESISAPDADLDPITRSILLLEAKEARLPHVRYHVAYSMNASTEVPEAQQAYVEVTRYNVGPALRAELLTSVPGGQVADAAQFGVGPHVSWRYVMAPTMGMRADLVFASRKEILAVQAEAADCLGDPCLSLIDPSGPDLDWRPIPSPRLEQPAYVGKNSLETTQPARVIQELWASIGSDGMDVLPYNREQPHFVFVVSLDIAGQEAMVSGLVKQPLVMDDAVSEIWTQRNEVAQIPAEFSRTYVKRR